MQLKLKHFKAFITFYSMSFLQIKVKNIFQGSVSHGILLDKTRESLYISANDSIYLLIFIRR